MSSILGSKGSLQGAVWLYRIGIDLVTGGLLAIYRLALLAMALSYGVL